MILSLALASLSALSPSSDDWYVHNRETVDCDLGIGTAELPFCTIAEAIAAAASGDRILIRPGTYEENVVVDRDLEFIGVEGRDKTVLVAKNLTLAVMALGGGTDTVLRGLSIQDGEASGITLVDGAATLLVEDCRIRDNENIAFNPRGGGLHAEASAVTLVDTEVTGNVATLFFSTTFGTGFGGGIYVADGSLDVVRCTIADNVNITQDIGYGGGIYAANSAVTIRDSRVTGNSVVSFPADGGGICTSGGTLLVERSVIRDNDARKGGGLTLFGTTATLVSAEVTDNVTTSAGSALQVQGSPILLRECTVVGTGSARLIELTNGGALDARDTIVWHPNSATPPIVGDPASLAASVVHYSNVTGGWSGAGTGNIDVALPQFQDAAGGDYRLLATSPFVDAGDPAFHSTGKDAGGSGRLIDGDLDRTARVDLGAYEFTNVRLSVGGNATPGGAMTFDLTGSTEIEFAILAVSSNPSPGTFVARLGSLFFDPALPFSTVSLGALPASLNASLPPTFPLGTTLVFQALGLTASVNGRRAGNVSNPVELTVE